VEEGGGIRVVGVEILELVVFLVIGTWCAKSEIVRYHPNILYYERSMYFSISSYGKRERKRKKHMK
jgi:hypothetical protein